MKVNLQLMLFIESVFLFAGGLFGPLYAVFITKIGGNILDVGIASTLYFLTAGIIIHFVSKWEDHEHHKENLYILGYFLSAWAFLGFIIINSKYQLFALQVLQGVGLAISFPVRDSLYTRFLETKKSRKKKSKLSQLESLTNLTYAFSALAGGYLAYVYGFRTLFLYVFMMLILGIGVFSFLYVKYEKELHKEKHIITGKKITKKKRRRKKRK